MRRNPAVVKENPLAERTGPVPTIISVFHRSAAAMVRDLVDRLAAAGFTGFSPAHQAVFENLDPGGTRLNELAARAEMTHQSMSELVTVLEQHGYLERRVDPRDRRARIVILTGRGRRLARRALHEIAEIEAEWRGRLAGTGVRGDIVGSISTVLAGQPERSDASMGRRRRRNA